MELGTDQQGNTQVLSVSVTHPSPNYSKSNAPPSGMPKPMPTGRYILSQTVTIPHLQRRIRRLWTPLLHRHQFLPKVFIPPYRLVLQYSKLHPEWRRERVIDCGAGIGRISKELLCQTFKEVDVVDQCEELIEQAKNIVKGRKYFVCGLQEFEFAEKYDCIWVQWVMSHLTDQHAVGFFRRAKDALRENGVIVVKENVCREGFVVDREDRSVTRSRKIFRRLFQSSGVKVVMEGKLEQWPKELFDVVVYVLQ